MSEFSVLLGKLVLIIIGLNPTVSDKKEINTFNYEKVNISTAMGSEMLNCGGGGSCLSK